MNDRIRALAEQAWEYAEENSREPYVDIYDTCLEKFAELIVRECALQCVHNEDMDRIEKHFGVKE